MLRSYGKQGLYTEPNECLQTQMLNNDTNAIQVQIRQGRCSHDGGRKDEVIILIASMKTSRQLLVAIKKQLQAN